MTYTPDDDFNGTDTFSYFINDGEYNSSAATVTIVVSAVNDPPIAVDDADTTDEDTPVEVDVLANDDDPDEDALTVAIFSVPHDGTAVVVADQKVLYTPDPNFFGLDSFVYRITDGQGASDVAIVVVTVSVGHENVHIEIADFCGIDESVGEIARGVVSDVFQLLPFLVVEYQQRIVQLNRPACMTQVPYGRLVTSLTSNYLGARCGRQQPGDQSTGQDPSRASHLGTP